MISSKTAKKKSKYSKKSQFELVRSTVSKEIEKACQKGLTKVCLSFEGASEADRANIENELIHLGFHVSHSEYFKNVTRVVWSE